MMTVNARHENGMLTVSRRPWRDDERRLAIWAGLLLLVMSWLYLAGHQRYGVFDTQEARLAQTSREMLHSGSYEPRFDLPVEVQNRLANGSGLLPAYNGMLRDREPPLAYWVQGLFMHVLGEDSLWAVRLPGALAALASVLLLALWLGRRTRNWRWAVLSGMVLGLNASMLLVGRLGLADALGGLFSLATVLSLLNQLYVPPGRSGHPTRRALLTGALAGLALLTAGAVTLLPGALVAAIVLLGRRGSGFPDTMTLWQRLNPWLIVSVALAGLVPWLLLMLHQSGGTFVRELLVLDQARAFTQGLRQGLSESHTQSSLYYLMVLLIGLAPWVLMLPQAGWWAARNLRSRLLSHRLDEALPAIALLWGGVYLLLLGLSDERMLRAVIPAYPALAVLVGGWLDTQLRQRVTAPTGPAATMAQGMVQGMGLAGSGGLPGALLLALLGVALLALNPLLEALRAPELTGLTGWAQSLWRFDWPPKDAGTWALLRQTVPLDPAAGFAGMLILAGVVPAYLVIWQLQPKRRGGGVVTLALCWSVVLGLLVWGGLPTLWRYQQAGLLGLAQELRAAAPGVPVIHLSVDQPSVLYASQVPFRYLEQPLQLPDYLLAPRTLVLAKLKDLPAVRNELGVLGTDGTRLVGVAVTRQQCGGEYCLLTLDRR